MSFKELQSIFSFFAIFIETWIGFLTLKNTENETTTKKKTSTHRSVRLEVIRKIPSNLHCPTDNTTTNMLTVSKISSLPSSTFLVQSKRIRERRGDNFRSLLAPPLSLLYTLLPVLNFLPVTVGRRGSRRRSGSRMGGEGTPPSLERLLLFHF